MSTTSDKFKPKSFLEIQEEQEFISRTSNKGIVNKETGSGVLINDAGDVELASSKFSHYTLSGGGISTERTMQSNTITNLKNMNVDSVVINRHKMNPALWELTDFKKTNGTKEQIVGNLNMTGTVLVKAWEPNLNKYVLIRRPVRMPMFSTTLNVADAPAHVNVSSGISKDLMEYLLKKKNETTKE